jgi:uncharacterized protein (DUF885 family)
MPSFWKKYRILFLSLLVVGLFFLLRSRINLPATDFDAFCEQLFQNELSVDTLSLHFTLADPASAGIRDYEVTLGSLSKDSPKASSRELNALQNQLAAFSRRSLSDDERLTYDLLCDYVNRQQTLSSFPYYNEVLTPSGGITSQLPVLLAEYPFRTTQDVEEYLTLLSQMDDYFSGVLEYEEAKAEAGLFMSDESCMKVLSGCEVFTENPTDNFLVETFAGRLEELSSLTEAQKADYIARNEAAIAEHVIPAYRQMIAGLSALLGSGQNDWGLCYAPKGSAYYEALVASDTGCDDSVESLFAQIETAREEDINACTALLAQDPQLAEASEALGDDLSDEEAMLSTLEEAMLADFPTPPETDWEICHVDPALSDYLAPAFYITAPLDDYRNNRIYINDADSYSDLYYFTTLAHEGFPGHLYQTVYTYSCGQSDVRALLNYPGYTEGWATYVEMQAYYYAGLDGDLAALLQHNQAAMLSLYATSDIGIHYYGWKENEMTDFWANYGITDADSVTRITSLILEEPGNYLKYYVGYLKFRQLREKYETEYGTGFDPAAFHEAILRIGPAPFSIVEEQLSLYY